MMEPDIAKSFSGQHYLDVPSFLRQLSALRPFPYASRFSFTPMMEVVKAATGRDLSELEPEVARADQLVGQISGEKDRLNAREKVIEVLGSLMPSAIYRDAPIFFARPFIKDFSFCSEAQEELMFSGEWTLKLDLESFRGKENNDLLNAGGLILETFYGQEGLNLFQDQVMTLRQTATGLERHFKINLNFDFIKVYKTKDLPALSTNQIQELLENLNDRDLWLKYLPADHFAFEGIGVGRLYDVTDSEVLSVLKDSLLLDEVENDIDTFMPMIEKQVRDFLGSAEIRIGMIGLRYSEFLQETCYSLTGHNLRQEEDFNPHTGRPGIYQQTIRQASPLVIRDLSHNEQPADSTKRLLQKGVRSIILVPLEDQDDEVCTVFEIASTVPNAFNELTLLRLKEVIDLLHLGNIRYLQRLENLTNMFIQQQFTSIHPSVQWKFEEVANIYQVRSGLPDFDGAIDPIVFEDVYPLYAQSDIVGSSRLRNTAIRADLIDNLKRVAEVMRGWIEELYFHLLEAYLLKVTVLIGEMESDFMSSHESQVMDLLSRELHPLLRDLAERFQALPKEPYERYLNALDDKLGIVYRHRKDYEISVSKLNQAISDYIEKDDLRMQEILPHYFEKYKTDGVEYNIYLGQSILRQGKFSAYFLRDFRLWQLIQMCEVTRLVDRLGDELPVKLSTAQLIFVYNTRLSIRFRMDEKQFDVDGTYNVRYEILKKRIDKAIVKGTEQRLTIAGKVSIVYLQEKERREYLEYIEFLIAKGYVEPDYEDLELAKLQGAEGLRALRLQVKAN